MWRHSSVFVRSRCVLECSLSFSHLISLRASSVYRALNWEHCSVKTVEAVRNDHRLFSCLHHPWKRVDAVQWWALLDIRSHYGISVGSSTVVCTVFSLTKSIVFTSLNHGADILAVSTHASWRPRATCKGRLGISPKNSHWLHNFHSIHRPYTCSSTEYKSLFSQRHFFSI